MLFGKNKTNKVTRKNIGTAEKHNRITNERIRSEEQDQSEENDEKDLDWIDELEMFEDIFDD
ncbi:MAG: hypothetical protein K6E85_04490 [Lachnospiraceae bacterium]|nr:hypothetical protein [Lachnospiraceae bacterium]